MSISFVGSTLAIAAAAPASEDASLYEALSPALTAIGKVVDISAVGDQSEDIAFTLLQPGRTTHVNGAKDMGEINVTVEYDATDAGQDIVRAAENSNTTHSFRVTDADGADRYWQGLIANVRDLPRNASQYKGFTFTVRSQTGTVDTDPA